MQLVAKTDQPVNGQDERAAPAVDSPACLCYPVIRRVTAGRAATLSHYPERGILWIAQKHIKNISNTHLALFAELSFTMRLSTHGVTGINVGKGKYLLIST